MASRRSSWWGLAAAALFAAAAGCGGTASNRPASSVVPLLGTTNAPSTSREDLAATIARLVARLRETPDDGAAAVQYADALLRQARVTGNAGHARTAEIAVRRIVTRDPEDYGACRMLAAVLLSAHRFADARTEGLRCAQIRQDDGWLMGVVGDASVELGDYDQAFDAFDAMMARRPNAAAYARAAYARELRGDVPGALDLMRMALSATSPRDPESMAWHHAQIGHLQLELGHTDDAARAFAHADHVFPGHPMATAGRARTLVAQGRLAQARDILAAQVAAMPVPDDLAFLGDIQAALGDMADAERCYTLAEAAWMSDAPDPSRLARFLAGRGRRVGDAVAIATAAARDRRDIFTADALAWALFRAGRLDEAQQAIERALATGSRDRAIRYHAAAIAHARGDLGAARRYVDESLDGSPRFDLVAAPAAVALRRELALDRGDSATGRRGSRATGRQGDAATGNSEGRRGRGGQR